MPQKLLQDRDDVVTGSNDRKPHSTLVCNKVIALWTVITIHVVQFNFTTPALLMCCNIICKEAYINNPIIG